MAEAFRKEWRDIDRRFAPLSDPPEGMSAEEHWRNLAAMRQSARDELRNSLREAAALGYGGIVPIPV